MELWCKNSRLIAAENKVLKNWLNHFAPSPTVCVNREGSTFKGSRHLQAWKAHLFIGIIVASAPLSQSQETPYFGADTSVWSLDGECDDPRFDGPGTPETSSLDDDRFADATDCRTLWNSGQIWLKPGVTRGSSENRRTGFGFDGSDWANDGECDDPRFVGPGMTRTPLLFEDIEQDASDCREASLAGTVSFRTGRFPEFGDDSGQYAKDGECDDARFIENGDDTRYMRNHVLRDATDCRAAFTSGTAMLHLDFGDDSGEWSNDGECDDTRFSGPARQSPTWTADTLQGRDASDCVADYRAGQLNRWINSANGTVDGAFNNETLTEVVASVQEGLKGLGYYRGPTNGVLTPDTRSAIRAFERDNDLDITGEATAPLLMIIGAAMLMDAAVDEFGDVNPDLTGSGSGFFVSDQGHVLTNHHVIEGCDVIELPGGVRPTLIASEEFSDLALLQVPDIGRSQSFLKVRAGRGVQLAESILVSGFPLNGIVTSDLNVTLGNVTALSGPEQNRGLFQISAPVQPGNSGGPVLDSNGRLVGVVVSKLDALAVADATGDIPQNINFAIALGTVQSFLDAYSVPYSEGEPTSQDLSNEAIAQIAQGVTIKVQCR